MSAAGQSGEGASLEVSFIPTKRARYLARGVPGAYDDIWGDLKRCVGEFPGVSQTQDASMFNQMMCHVLWGVGNLGGDTWDFEAWRPHRGLDSANAPSHGCNWDHGDDGGQALAGQIVQWGGDTKSHKTSWLVVRKGDGSLVRNHIPSAEVFSCLRDNGAQGPVQVAASFFDRYLPDEFGVQATCSRLTINRAPLAPSQQQAPESTTQDPRFSNQVIVVDNRVTNGGSQMREDTPAYLSTVTRNFCKRDGCALGGTDIGSGGTLTAICTTLGSRTTNGQDNSSIDDGNPGLYSSTRWYGIKWSDERFGYISEVWIAARHRGGLGLRTC